MNNNDLLRNRQAIISLLTAARIEKGISQQMLAEMIGTKRSNICRIESGAQNITLDMMLRIADALGKDITVLIQEKSPEQSSVSKPHRNGCKRDLLNHLSRLIGPK